MKVHLLPGETVRPKLRQSLGLEKPSVPTQLHCPSDGFSLPSPEDNALRHVSDAIDDYMETLVPGAQLRFLTRLREDASARLRVLKT